MSFFILLIIITALVFEFINGFHDTANAIATSIYTRALSPRNAIIIAAVANFGGALVSTKVAKTISHGVVDVTPGVHIIFAALLGAIIWNLITWWKGIPSSSSHALIGSLVGATSIDQMSPAHILWEGILEKIIIPLFASPVIGFLFGFGLMKLVFLLFAAAPRKKVNPFFAKLQIFSGTLVAFLHGTNDAQKTMGIITMTLIAGGFLGAEADVPLWVKIVCAIAMASGTAVGGFKIMKTMGRGVTKLDPPGGFSAQFASSVVIGINSFIGAPISTTHVITSSVIGVGSAKRIKAVKWSAAKNIVLAWVITIPISAILGGTAAFVTELFF
jgi:PiT family inorganic phosphate transporter